MTQLGLTEKPNVGRKICFSYWAKSWAIRDYCYEFAKDAKVSFRWYASLIISYGTVAKSQNLGQLELDYNFTLSSHSSYREINLVLADGIDIAFPKNI